MEKNNNSKITGNENIVIQDVNAANITINVNGKTQKLEIAMNQWLVKKLLPAIEPYQEIAKKFLIAVKEMPDWEQQSKYRNAALSVLQSSFIGIVGIYLKKLSAIGNSNFSAEKQKENIKNSYLLCLRLMDFVNISLLSYLLNFLQNNKTETQQIQGEYLKRFFNDSVERDLSFNFNLFNDFLQIFAKNKIDFPYPELKDLQNAEKLEPLKTALHNIEAIYSKIQQQSPTAEDSFRTEVNLTEILTAFSFLCKYKIMTVKEVNYTHNRFTQEFFIHKTNFVGLSSRQSEANKTVTEKINHAPQPVTTEAVIVYENDYLQGLNLYPFIIDYNNILLEQGTNLCVFSHKDLSEDNYLNFVSLNDNKLLGIEAQSTLSDIDFNQIFSDRKTIIQYRKDLIIKLISDAKRKFTNEDENQDDFLNTLLND